MAIAALIAVEPVADAVLKAIRQRMTGLRTGDGTRQVDMGPLVTRAHRDKVAGYIDAGLRDGAMLVVDGRAIEMDGEASGYWLGPTLFDGVHEGMSIYRDEIFAPVLCVLRVQSYTEALRLVNEHTYGNGTAIFTRDGGAAKSSPVVGRTRNRVVSIWAFRKTSSRVQALHRRHCTPR